MANIKKNKSTYEAFFSNGDGEKPIGKVFGGFKSFNEALNRFLEYAYGVESYVSSTYRVIKKKDCSIVDYGSYSKFITVRKSK